MPSNSSIDAELQLEDILEDLLVNEIYKGQFFSTSLKKYDVQQYLSAYVEVIQ